MPTAEDVNKNIEMPPLPEEPEQPIEEVVVEEQEAPEPVEAKQEEQPNDTEKNFAAIRNAKAKAERERDAAYQRLKELENMQQMQSQTQAQADPEPGDDELVEWKHVKKTVKGLEQRLNTYQQSNYETSVDVRLRQEFPDYEKIVSKDNVDLLRDAYPELAGSVASNPDLYSKAVSAYKLIKQFGIHKEDTYAKDREIAQKNAAKPRPLVSASPQQGESPLTRANAFAEGLTDSLKKQLREEMEAARRAH